MKRKSVTRKEGAGAAAGARAGEGSVARAGAGDWVGEGEKHHPENFEGNSGVSTFQKILYTKLYTIYDTPHSSDII